MNSNGEGVKILLGNGDNYLMLESENDITQKAKYGFTFFISIDESFISSGCSLTITINPCYQSCKGCSIKASEANQENHNCLECKDGYYPFSGNRANCFTIEEVNTDHPNWYFDEGLQEFGECHSSCKTCSGPLEENCLICDDSDEQNPFYLYEGKCLSHCPERTFPNTDENGKKICQKCYKNCKTCEQSGNADDMKCTSCQNDNIKYLQNCYEVYNINDKSFYDPEDNTITTSCLQKHQLYIKENENECIDKPENYFISNTITGVISECDSNCKTCSESSTNCLSCNDGLYLQEGNCVESCLSNYYIDGTNCFKCHDNCLTCETGKQLDETGNLINMKCLTCKNGMIKNEENCFPVEEYESNKITFNINEIDSSKTIGTCLDLNKAIFYETYECISKPSNTYYVISNEDNTGVIKNCDIACDECHGEKTEEDTNCINCASGYSKIKETDTNCILESLLPTEPPIITEKPTEKPEIPTEKIKPESPNTSNPAGKCAENLFLTLTGECASECPSGTYQFMLNHTCLESCPENYKVNNENNRCIRIIFEDKVTPKEFKTEIIRDIVSYVNSTNVINCTTFVAVVLSSGEMNVENQIKSGISAINFRDKGLKIKRHYDIPDDEEIIVLSMQKNNQTETEEKTDIKLNFQSKIGAVIGKDIEIEVYDLSGRKLDITDCEEEIEVAKYIGDEEEKIDIESAQSFAEMGIDVFNSSSEFFNDLCYEYDNIDGKDITMNDRRTDVYQNVSFCKEGCTYVGVDYDLKVASCICDAAVLQSEGNNTNNNDNQAQSNSNTFESLVESFIKNWLDFNIDVVKCYNLIFNPRILKQNIGFFVMTALLVAQMVFLVIFFIKRMKPIKSYMLNFKSSEFKQNKAVPPRKDGDVKRYNTQKRIKYKKSELVLEGLENEDKKENLKEEVKKNHKKKSHHRKSNRISTQMQLITDNNNLKDDIENNNEENKDNFDTVAIEGQPSSKTNNKFIANDKSKKKHLTTKNKVNNIVSENILNEKIKFPNTNKRYIKHKTTKSRRSKIKISEDFNEFKTTTEKELKEKSGENSEKISYSDEELHGMDFEETKVNDQRSYIRMYWSFLVDSQIILGTFFTDNYLHLLIIKLSFFVINYQISFFLNALFYTDEYISEAYHNDGVLDIFTGLPKAIYSFIATLIITNLLVMLYNNKEDLLKVLREKRNYKEYLKVINSKLRSLRNKLIAYYIIIFILGIFFLYYVSAFCAVYRNSQKYLFLGFVESFDVDTIVAIVLCIILSLLRYVAINKNIKCLYSAANFISTFL